MSFRKHSLSTTPPRSENDLKCNKPKESNLIFNLQRFRSVVLTLVAFAIWFLLISFWFPFRSPPVPGTFPATTKLKTREPLLRPAKRPVCNGSLPVYVYELPEEFNLGLLKDCRHLNVYTDMCPHVANHGLGQQITSVNDSQSWFSTHQFIAEMIFHARMENHPCRTHDPERAAIFYVPFYGGLHASSKFRESNLTARDELALKLVEYLKKQVWWRRHYGKDHFIAIGRTSWDFMRLTNGGADFGANVLFNLPDVLNATVLTVERHPWQGVNQFGIPYPSYFHPFSPDELQTWQDNVRRNERPHLFSFIGGPRKGVEKAAIRDELIKQCGASTSCQLIKCGKGASKCHDPMEVLKVMMESEFCLQAPGDSFTRRSTFDSVLAGCIPVFLSKHTAYSQYGWYLPSDYTAYSVYMDENGEESKRIEKELMKISESSKRKMRERVIDLIPKLTYVHPNSTRHWPNDAVSVALAALSKRVVVAAN